MTDADLIAKWQRLASRRQWAHNHLPRRARTLLSALYQQTPTARADRRGAASRARIAKDVHDRCRGIVQRGPFAGMIFPFATWDAPAKCIGSYERELHPAVERIIAHGYRTIVNVGCAEGFYAVGLARAIPTAVIHAYDTAPEAVARCQRLAEANSVPVERMTYGGEVTHAVLDALCEPGALVIVDIEGGEAELMDPLRVPRLANVDVLLELHHHVVSDIEQVIRDRFTPTHSIRHVDSEPRTDSSPYAELVDLPLADRLLAMFERPIVMRWLIMESVAKRG